VSTYWGFFLGRDGIWVSLSFSLSLSVCVFMCVWLLNVLGLGIVLDFTVHL
jgi:hypothetical protein